MVANQSAIDPQIVQESAHHIAQRIVAQIGD